MVDERIILALPVGRESVSPPTHFRSTWIVSSQQRLQKSGYFDRYLIHLTKAQRDALAYCVAGAWLPMALARAHYAACDALALSADEQLRMGQLVGDQGAATLISTVAKVAKGVGVTPWSIFPHFDRVWRRGADGGAVMVTRLGPKDALGEVVACALFDVPYFRVAFRGVVLGMMQRFSSSMFIREFGRRPPGEIRLRFQWA
jgi:hypothetical protein